MIGEAVRLAHRDPTKLADAELAKEIERRSAIHGKWVDVYWSEFIPFAHGARLLISATCSNHSWIVSATSFVE